MKSETTSTDDNLMSFQFSEEKQEIRSLIVNDEICFMANDACEILGLTNPRDILKKCLDEDEKLTYTVYTSGQNRKVNLVTESGLYALIFQSRKPQAKKFRKWITAEVIPSLRKNGYYQINQPSKFGFIDWKNELYSTIEINSRKVRVLEYKNEQYYNINDLNKVADSSTSSNQQVKRLSQYCLKFWLVGNTQPGWFINTAVARLLQLTYKSNVKLLNA
jgi:prophage antirepressor-like protein